MTALALDTPHGVARAYIEDAGAARGVVVLGHGAGGGVAARDLVEARDVALAVGLSIFELCRVLPAILGPHYV